MSEPTTVQQLLDEAKNHEDGIADDYFPVPEDAQGRLLYVLAMWSQDDILSPADALEEYGDRFLETLKDAGLKVVLEEA
jgi:hypothetical protein